MKALTLTQPWAMLVVAGLKQYETRSWKTKYRGVVAIHAAKGYPNSAEQFAFKLFYLSNSTRSSKPVQATHPLLMQGFIEALIGAHTLTRGAVIGQVRIVDCVPVESVRDSLSDYELALGNYADGRFAWKLEDPQVYPSAIPAKGALSLWEWKCDRSGACLVQSGV